MKGKVSIENMPSHKPSHQTTTAGDKGILSYGRLSKGNWLNTMEIGMVDQIELWTETTGCV